MTNGKETLENAEWLLGFDFDGTLANIEDNHSVVPTFFESILRYKSQLPLSWGICTGRSLPFILEGMDNAGFPFLPDFLVTQERDIYYLTSEQTYEPDAERNAQAKTDLLTLLGENQETLKKVERYVTQESKGEWVSIPDDPAGIIASHQDEIQKAVDIFDSSNEKCSTLEYQRNSIYLRFTHKEYCKGTAVQHLQKTFGINKNQTLVMGDNYNDLTMLNSEIAQSFGAPSNAIPELKEALTQSGGFITESPHALGVIEAMDALFSAQQA